MKKFNVTRCTLCLFILEKKVEKLSEEILKNLFIHIFKTKKVIVQTASKKKK